MTGPARRSDAARERLARLVVAVAILAGLGLAIGLQCTDGMAMPATPMAPGTNSMACDIPAGMADQPAAACAGASTGASDSAVAAVAAVAVVGEDVPGPHGLGGLLATCLAFILAVVAAAATLRPRPVHGVARLLRSARVMIRTVRPRAPRLAELCLLRT